MAFIYALVCGDLILYVGQTKHPKQRSNDHKKKNSGVGSGDIPVHIDWEMRILEECQHSDRLYRERYWYDLLKPLYNKRVPGKTKEEHIKIQQIYQECCLRREQLTNKVNMFLLDIGVDIHYENIDQIWIEYEDWDYSIE